MADRIDLDPFALVQLQKVLRDSGQQIVSQLALFGDGELLSFDALFDFTSQLGVAVGLELLSQLFLGFEISGLVNVLVCEAK